jgi:predicted AAA+ superfamily ATPase
VDFILDENIAIEVKGKSRLSKDDFKGMRALQAEKAMKSYIIVSLESVPRDVDGICVMPWETFLKDLWAGALK